MQERFAKIIYQLDKLLLKMLTNHLKFDSSTYCKLLILADILQLMQLFESIALYFDHRGNEAECRNALFSLYFSLAIFIVYCIITVLIGFGKNQDDGNIQIILQILYMAQQISFFVRYKPLSNAKELELYF